MPFESFTLLDDGRAIDVLAEVDGDRIGLDPDSLRSALGWELKAEGLCRESVCIPVRDRTALTAGGAGLRLAGLAELLSRPLAFDGAERAAALGTSAADRGSRLMSLEAADFSLPDLDGEVHSLSRHRGEKILLYMHASW